MTRVVAPSGEQYEISGSGYRAVVTECGAGLRLLEHEGRPLVDGYDESAMATGGQGQLLVPWPTRIRDGQYAVGDRQLQLPLSEPGGTTPRTGWCGGSRGASRSTPAGRWPCATG